MYPEYYEFMQDKLKRRNKLIRYKRQEVDTLQAEIMDLRVKLDSFMTYYKKCWCTESEGVGTCCDCHNTGWVIITQ